MVVKDVDELTASVIESLKSGEKKPQDFMNSKAKLAAQGVDVDFVEQGLRSRGMLKETGTPLKDFLISLAEGAGGTMIGLPYAKGVSKAAQSLVKGEGKRTAAQKGLSGVKEGVENAITAAEFAGGFTPYSPAIMGAGESSRALLKGQNIPEALKRGVMAASLDAAFLGIGKYAAKGLGALSTAGVRMAKKIPKPVMNQAIKNPDLLLTPQKAITDVSDDIVRASQNLKRRAGDRLEQELGNLLVKNKVSTRGVKNAIIKYGGDPGIIGAKMAGEARKQGLQISDGVIEAFFSGKKVSFEDARKLNSLLGAVQRDLERVGTTAELGGAMLGRIRAAKDANLKAMELAAPGIRNLNRQYAIDRTIAEKAVAALRSPSSQKAVASELLGKVTTKTKEARNLLKLDKAVGAPLTENLKDAYARQIFEQQAENAIMGYATPRSLIGGLLGMSVGGPGGGALGATAMNLLPHALTPQAIGYGIKAAPLVSKAGGAIATPLRIGLERQMVNP